MTSSSKNSSKDILKSNPIQAILDLIPYAESVLDYQLMDAIALAIVSHTKASGCTNSAIIVLLSMLHEAGLIILNVVQFPSTPGKVHFIQRKT